MRIADDKIRQALAAEYVLGTLSARVRRRFQSLLRYDAGLRAMVEQWERRLDPLSEGLNEREPPPRVWSAIAQRLRPARAAPRLDETPVRFWRALAIAVSVMLVIGIGFVGGKILGDRRPDMMALL